jgi:Thermostable hemolysin
MQAAIISRDHDLRSAAEQLIAEVYALQYSARITAFPATLIAMIGDGGAPLCAAGLRFAVDGFFSECYLDAPVDAVLSALRRYPVAREKVFEVTSLASRAPHTIGPFLRKIMACGEAAGFEWAFFTATAPLKLILERLSLSLLPLAPAEPSRVTNPDAWGSYYDLTPNVYAVHRQVARACVGKQARVAAHG